MEPEKLKIRPFARLLTMLGEQLIKNERIALVELIKNSYDADAEWVKVSFCDFEKDFTITTKSKIIIEDSGSGMSKDIMEKHWLNPATPEKLLRKKTKSSTKNGRIIQGEKGIGRFAVLKLGRDIKVISRAEGSNIENTIRYDFSKYDDDFLTEDGKEKELYIDDLPVFLESKPASNIFEGEVLLGIAKKKMLGHGTRIEISNLKGTWSDYKVSSVYRDVNRLESIFNKDKDKAFNIWIYKDDELQNPQEKQIEDLTLLLEERAVLKINEGFYNEELGEFKFLLNGEKKILKLSDPEIKGLNVFKKHFGQKGISPLEKHKNEKTECGNFTFSFYVFDFNAKTNSKYYLDHDEKNIIRDHRVYLYRDEIRVYPYGEADDDWLRIDTYRGTISAGAFLSNDQVVGYVNITQKENPKLKDKTNREGLIDEGNSTEDFLALLRVILAYIRQKPYGRYIQSLESKHAHDTFKTEIVQKKLDQLKEMSGNNQEVISFVKNFEKDYQTERKYLIRRAETTEELAGVGLSVETASHDIMAIMTKAMFNLDSLIKDIMFCNGKIDINTLEKDLQALKGMLSFIEAQMKDIQLLFKSSKQRRRNIRVKEIIEKVERIYRRLLEKNNIKLIINEYGAPLIAKTTDAVLLQLSLNLLDNSIYWLQQQVDNKEKKIEIKLDGDQGQMIFSDNGPGIKNEDIPYIFNSFFTGRGEEGRGLGLYIARQLLERNDYSIDLAELKAEKILSGANFVVNFITEDK